MDRRVDKINEITASELMGHLARIISASNIEKIKLQHSLAMKLPLKVNHHEVLMTKLKLIRNILNDLFMKNWDQIWKEEINAALIKEHKIGNDLSCQIKEQAKVWIKTFFDILEAKIQSHQEIKAQLAMHDEGACVAGANAEFIQKVQSLRLN